MADREIVIGNVDQNGMLRANSGAAHVVIRADTIDIEGVGTMPSSETKTAKIKNREAELKKLEKELEGEMSAKKKGDQQASRQSGRTRKAVVDAKAYKAYLERKEQEKEGRKEIEDAEGKEAMNTYKS